MSGVKFDSEKAPLDLLPYESLEEIAKVLAAGEKKYGTANWANGIEMRRLLSAAMRHIGQFNSGEDFDSETSTIHLANAAANLLFAIWMYKHRPDLDNRWAKTLGEEEKQIPGFELTKPKYQVFSDARSEAKEELKSLYEEVKKYQNKGC
jgi:hypothetical protein